MSPRSGSAESALSSESMKKMRKSRGICPASSRITVCSDDTVICLDTPTEQPDEPDRPNVPFGRMDREVRIIVMGENRKYFSFDTSSETKISKAIYRRNEQVEKRLGISLKMIDVHSSDFFQRIRVSQLGANLLMT